MILASLTSSLILATHGEWKLKDNTRCSIAMVRPKTRAAWTIDGSKTDSHAIFDELLQKRLGLRMVIERMDQPLLVVQGTATSHGVQLPNLRLQFDGTPVQDLPLVALGRSDRNWISAIPLDNISGVHSVKMGIASGAWRDAGSKHYRIGSDHSKPNSTVGVTFEAQIGPAPRSKDASSTQLFTELTVQAKNSIKDLAVRYLVFDAKGKEMKGAGYYRPKNTTGVTKFFFQGDYHSVSQLKLQARSFEWHTIPGVHLSH